MNEDDYAYDEELEGDELVIDSDASSSDPVNILSQQTLAQLRRLMELRDAKDEAEVAAKRAAASYRDAEAAAFESLSGIKGSIKPDLGPPWGYVQFSARETHYGRVYDEQAAKEYFERMKMTGAMSAPKFVKKRLNEIARECREQDKTPPPGIDWTTSRGVTITRQKGG